MKKLERLDLSDNLIRVIPPSVGDNKGLMFLAVMNNQLNALPSTIVNLKGLTEFFLGGNKFVSFPHQILGVTKLQSLDLSDNSIRTIPSNIDDIKKLRHLYLDNNKLNSLPHEITRLNELEQLFLHDNPELGLDASVLGPTWREHVRSVKGITAKPKDILDLYFEKEKSGKPLNEVKILLVGAGEVGKSSIVDNMVHRKPFSQHKKETPGIAIADWSVEVQGSTVTAHVWDFAGQEITHETHRFFLTERSLYLVVLDHRRDQEGLDAVYWLRHVQQYGKDSPVIVVLNKADENPDYAVDEGMLVRRFPNIRGFVRTACSKENGCEDLESKVKEVLTDMDDVRAEWPTSFLGVKSELAKRNRAGQHIILYSEFELICAEHRVDADKRAGLGRSLHNLGAALWYGDDPRLADTRVLSPNWVANGLYGILRGGQKNPIGRSAGEVRIEDVGRLLEIAYAGNAHRNVQLEDYPLQHHGFLLNLLVDRGLALIMNPGKDNPMYLIPSLLPAREPAKGVVDIAALIDRSQVHFRYSYSLLPSDVIARFVVLSQALSKDQPRWKNGVVVRWRSADAVVLATKGPDQVEVHVSGVKEEDCQHLCGLIRDYMEEAQPLFGDVQINQELAILNLPSHWEPLIKLQAFADANRPVPVVFNNALIDVDARQELARIHAGRRFEPIRKLTAFVSYSHDNVPLRLEWDRYLKVLQQDGLLDHWHDAMLQPDDRVDERIMGELSTADVIILLMSVDLMGSVYVRSKELPEIVRRWESKQCRLIPVVLRNWVVVKDNEHVKRWNPLPEGNDKRPKAIVDFADHDTGWDQVYDALREILEDLNKK